MQTHSIYVLEFAIKVTEFCSKAFLERLKFRRDFSCFLEKYI